MQNEKTEAIRGWSLCRLTEIRKFMGTCGYYRSFVKDFFNDSTVIWPDEKRAPFIRTNKYQEEFDENEADI